MICPDTYHLQTTVIAALWEIVHADVRERIVAKVGKDLTKHPVAEIENSPPRIRKRRGLCRPSFTEPAPPAGWSGGKQPAQRARRRVVQRVDLSCSFQGRQFRRLRLQLERILALAGPQSAHSKLWTQGGGELDCRSRELYWLAALGQQDSTCHRRAMSFRRRLCLGRTVAATLLS